MEHHLHRYYRRMVDTLHSPLLQPTLSKEILITIVMFSCEYRVSRAVELISVNSVGKQGNDNSGLTFWGRGFYSVNISNDGRYVVFEFAATNLGHGLNLECSRLHANMCNILYVHDRLTGGTELVTALPNQDFSFFSEISADGRWISFMQSFYNCSPTQFFCSNVMLYDRQRGWMTNLTKFDEGTPSLPWSYYGSLVLPWESWESSALAFSPDGKLIALGGYDFNGENMADF